jgi:glycosyltransferase involved in cell wall biosynthesis
MKPQESGVKLLIAGSAFTPVEQKIVDDAVKEFGDHIYHVGHIDGREKEEFFEKIDVFIFPSLYVHEAAPLVCLESMSAGVPFIAYDWGYVKSSTSPAGTFINSDEAFEEQALRTLRLWASEPQEYRKNAEAARAAFDRLTTQSSTQIDVLIRQMRSD